MFFDRQNPRLDGKSDSAERARERASLEIADLEPRILLSATWIDPSQLEMEDVAAGADENLPGTSEGFSSGDALLMSWLDGVNPEASSDTLESSSAVEQEEESLEAENEELVAEEILVVSAAGHLRVSICAGVRG